MTESEYEYEEGGARGADEERPSFRARLINPNIIACGLRGISNGKRDQYVQVEVVAEEGIRFLSTDPTKSLQACASISERFFEEWQMDDMEVSFRVNLPVLLDCLTMLGSGEQAQKASPLLLEFRKPTACLSMQLVEVGAVTECMIRTIAYDEWDGGDEIFDFAGAFRQADSVNKAIVASDLFRDAFQELSELYGAQSVTVTMDPSSLRLSARSETGVCYIDFGKAFFSLFECNASLEFTYRLALLQRASKPLGEAEKTFMRVNSEGILSFQHLLKQSGGGEKTYVDVFVLADFEEGEEGSVV
ncbi:hypothetical protein BASA81_001733 [Batrachochytrium salamandrivorans]|nr:hypothetical protein BASA81_001733 [Batrachochytrium salamandrivorans]